MPKFALNAQERFMIRTRMMTTPCGTVEEQARYDKLWDVADIGGIDDMMHASPNRSWSEAEFDGEPKEYDVPLSIMRTIKDLLTQNPARPIPYGMTRLAKPLLKRIEESPDLTS